MRREALESKLMKTTWKNMIKSYELYLFLVPVAIYYLLFHYVPMYGVQIAFKNFVAVKGISGSPWVGLQHFERFFNSYQFWRVISNTLLIGGYELLLFPIPIMMAILLNQLVFSRFKRLVQTVTFAPHFISIVVFVGIIYIFLSPRNGIVNQILSMLGFKAINFLGSADWFMSIFVWSGVWQNAGWGMIIYLAALAGINPELHEAATVDGATKFQRVLNVDIPGIMPTVIIMLILHMGNFMNVGFEKVFLMQNSLNSSTSEVIQTYVYKTGLLGAQYSYSAAIGLFNSVVNCILLISVNQLARRFKTSLW
jgi:putative aldouronate transport system permease protein